MQKELSDLTFKMNQSMIDYYLYLAQLKEQMDALDQETKEYKHLKHQFDKYKIKFISEFQLINADIIKQMQKN